MVRRAKTVAGTSHHEAPANDVKPPKRDIHLLRKGKALCGFKFVGKVIHVAAPYERTCEQCIEARTMENLTYDAVPQAALFT